MLRWSFPLLLLLATACDPCSGVATCGTPQVRYEGEVRLRFRNEPAAGIRVEFVRTGGVRLEPGRIVTRSDSLGRFLLQGAAGGEGQVIGDLILYPPEPISPIRVEGVRIATSRAAGELRHLGSWSIPHPYFPYIGELYYRGSNEPASGIRVEFRRTGGIPLEQDTVKDVTDFAGRFRFDLKTLVQGEVIGELVIFPRPPYRSYAVPGLKLSTRVVETQPMFGFRSGIGPHLPWAGLLIYDDTRRPAEGVEVEFRRTGGIPVTPERYTTRTNAHGTFSLDPLPLTSGEVRGELIVRPPAPYRTFAIPDVRLSTVEVDRASELAGVWLIPAP